MEKKFSNLKVGDTVWVTVHRYRGSKLTEDQLEKRVVKKIGRIYVTVGVENGTWDDAQFTLDRGLEKSDGNYRRSLYLNDEEYYAQCRLIKLWRAFHNRIHNHFGVVEGITEEEIREVARILKIDLKEENE